MHNNDRISRPCNLIIQYKINIRIIDRMDREDELEMQYQKMEEDKQKVYGSALQTVGNIKKIVKNTGQ